MRRNVKNFWRQTGDVASNVGLGVADIGLSALGASNVIQTDDYKGESANSFGAVTDITGGVAKAAAPIIANAIVPGSGMIISGVQRAGSYMNPQNISGDPIVGKVGTGIELAGMAAAPFLMGLGQGSSAPAGTTSGMNSGGAVSMAPAGPMVARYGGMMRYRMGGEPNAEVENNEYITTNTPPAVYEGGSMELVSNNPYGTPTYETNGRSHENGGIVTELAPGTIINGKTKNPETGNKFSVDMEKLTSRENKYTKMLAKATDKRTRQSIETSLLMLAAEKERLNELQQSIIETKEKNQMEKDFFELGGMVSYKKGGIHINPKNKGKFTAAAKRAGMGVQEYARHVLANKENYSSTLVKRANFARNAAKWKHEEGGQIPNRFYPTSDEYGIYEQGGFLPLHLANRFYPDTSVGGMMRFDFGGMTGGNPGNGGNRGTLNPVTTTTMPYMTTEEWTKANQAKGYLPVPNQTILPQKYTKFYNPKEYVPSDTGFTKIQDVGKQVDYNQDPTYNPYIEYYGSMSAPVTTVVTPTNTTGNRNVNSQIGYDQGAVGNTPEALDVYRQRMNIYREKRGLPLTKYSNKESGYGYRDGGKIPTTVLKSRLESHMTEDEVNDYLSKYSYEGKMDLEKFNKGGKKRKKEKEKAEYIPTKDIAFSTMKDYWSKNSPTLGKEPMEVDIKPIKDLSDWKMTLPKPDPNISNAPELLKEYAPNIIGGLAENVGNLFVMAEKGPEGVAYERATARYMDPTASMRDADRQARVAAYDIANRGAGKGEYIASRAALASRAADLKDKYFREYENMNAQIANRLSEYNTQLSKEERNAQAANEAAYRNMRRAAIGSIGYNVAGTTKDISQYNRDKEMVSMLPELYNSPEFKEFFKKYKEKKLGK